MVLKLTVLGNPATKKNSGQIVKRGRRHILIPSKRYISYEKDFIRQITGNLRLEIDYKVNVKALYYRATRHLVDISNLHNALHDCLVVSKVLKDDNYKIIHSTDGSRVYFDKNNPRVEVVITKALE